MRAGEFADIVGSALTSIPKTIHDPFISKDDHRHVMVAMEEGPTGYAETTMFEAAIAGRLGRRFALGTSSGTAALHLAMLAVGVKPNSVVVMPTLNFVAAAAAARYCGATPFFADHGPHVQHIVTNQVSAIVYTHLLGMPDIDISRVPKYPIRIPIIEDAAEALGSSIAGKPCGSFGDVSILSFNNNKIVTTGGGGMLLTDDQKIYEKAKHLATTAKIPSQRFYWHDDVGFNYRMPNICAAMGLGQIARLDLTLLDKRDLAHRYAKAFAGVDGYRFMVEEDGTRSNYWLNAVVAAGREYRDRALDEMAAAGLPARAMFTPMHLMKPYARFPHSDDMRRAEGLADTVVCLPSGSGL